VAQETRAEEIVLSTTKAVVHDDGITVAGETLTFDDVARLHEASAIRQGLARAALREQRKAAKERLSNAQRAERDRRLCDAMRLIDRPIAEIAAQFGLSDDRAREIYRTNCREEPLWTVKRRERQAQLADRNRRIYAEVLRGDRTRREIGREFGISEGRVWQIFRDMRRKTDGA
jgi:DNA-directed RNA polymerase specialized sigma subunit